MKFKDHVLTTLTDTEAIKAYSFKHPDHSNYRQEWVFIKATQSLCVTGDCYEAIYTSGALRSIESAASCNIGYFMGNCVASPDGRDQTEFSREKATHKIHELIIEHLLDEDDSGNLSADQCLGIIKKINDDQDTNIPLSFDDEYDAVIWIRESAGELISHDWWDGFSMSSPTVHPYFHLAALKVAAAQLEEKKEVQT